MGKTNIVKSLPFWADWIVYKDKEKDIFIDRYGLPHTSLQDFSLVDENGGSYYAEYEDGFGYEHDLSALYIYEIRHNSSGFYGKLCCFFTCDKYGTVEQFGDESICSTVIAGNRKFQKCTPAVSAFTSKAASKLQWGYVKAFEIREPWKWFRLFAEGWQPLLYALYPYSGGKDGIPEKSKVLFDFFSYILDYGEFDYPVHKNAVKFSYDYQIPLRSSAELFSKYSHTEIIKFIKTMECFNKGMAKKVIIEAADAEISDFTKFCDYFVRQVFICGAVRIDDASGNSAAKWMQAYKDYLIMGKALYNGEFDPYPENMKQEHDRLAATACHGNRSAEESAKFMSASFQYRHYKWSYKEYSIDVPRLLSDLDREACYMHSCISSYADKVSDGTSKICFLRKDGKPCASIEVRENRIRQALGRFNQSIDEEDWNVLLKWAGEKNLIAGEKTIR